MNYRLRTLLSFVLLLVAVGCMAEDKTKTKNNKAEIYDNLYEVYVEAKKHRSDSMCLHLCDSMRALAIKQNDKRAVAMSYALPVGYYLNNENEIELNKAVEQQMKAAEEVELWSFYYFALSQKAVFLLRKNRMAEAIDLAEKTMKKAYADNNKNGIFVSHTMHMNCYTVMRLYKLARDEAEKALQAEIGLPDNEFGGSLSRLIEANANLRDFQAGLDAIEKYGSMVTNNSVKVRMCEYKLLFSYMLGKKSEFRNGYKELQSLYETYGTPGQSVKDVVKVFYLYDRGNIKEAEIAARDVSVNYKVIYLAEMYRDISNVDTLYSMLKSNDEDWSEKINRLYDADLKKYDLELDNHNLKLREKEILDKQHENRVRAILILLLVCMVFAGLLYWREQRSRRKLQKAYTKLNNQKIQLEEQLIAVKEANMANDAKTSFLFNMSHDIRTPMNAILGFANLLEKEKDKPEMVSNYLEKIKSSGQFLLSLINNVLDMARIESGKMELDEDFCDILDAKNNTVELFGDMAKRKHITLNYSHNVEHRYVKLDQMKVRQIILNLVSNAIKYTPDGGTVNYTFEEIPCEREGYVTFVSTVSDTGIGMSEEYAKTIFDMFSRERNTTESKQEGTGLGMSIVKRLVDLMGGTIELKTELGKGSTFIVTMSHQIVENPEDYLQTQMHVDTTETATDLTGKRILLAEDNDMNAEIAMAILEEVGLVVEHAEDGVQCVKMLSEADADYYDVILMDVQMPNMNGYEATDKIRKFADKKKATIPILAMTANAFEEDRKKALSCGMNGHLAKPIDVAELMTTVARFVK